MSFFRIIKYLQFRWQAKNAHGIHSPFVFGFYNQVLKRKYSIPNIESEIKRRYLNNTERINFQDPKTRNTIHTSIRSLAKRTWSGKSFSFFLLKLCEWLNTTTFLETGTALGMTSSIVSFAKGLKSVCSIEGSQDLTNHARKLSFSPEGVHVEIIQGNIYDVFEEIISKKQPEVIFLDADHRPEAIQFYLSIMDGQLKQIKAIVIHDIYWSIEMNQAWNEIIKDPKYPLTIDCYHAGIIFPQLDMEKQHFHLVN